MRKWIFNNEEYEGIKLKKETWERIGKPKGVFAYRGHKLFMQFYDTIGYYCYFVVND